MKKLTLLLAIVLTARLGTITYDGHRETYYNLKMNKIVERADTLFGTSGMYSVREDGCKMYGSFIICAADWDKHPYGSIVQTSLGTGIVLDTGNFTDRSTIDIATEW